MKLFSLQSFLIFFAYVPVIGFVFCNETKMRLLQLSEASMQLRTRSPNFLENWGFRMGVPGSFAEMEPGTQNPGFKLVVSWPGFNQGFVRPIPVQGRSPSAEGAAEGNAGTGFDQRVRTCPHDPYRLAVRMHGSVSPSCTHAWIRIA